MAVAALARGSGNPEGLWLPTATRRWLGRPWPGDGQCHRPDGARVPLRGRVMVGWCGVLVLLGGVQQGEGVVEALVEDLIGELRVG